MRTIFFDFFGVLSTSMYSQVIDIYLPRDEQVNWLQKLDEIDRGSLPEADFVGQLAERLGREPADLQKEADATPRFNEPLFAYIANELKPKYTIGLLTNVPRSLMERVAADKLPLFDVVVISSDLKLTKPDRRIFEAALQQANCKPEESVFIDDRAPNIEAAEALGMHGLLYHDFASMQLDLAKLLREQ